MNTNLKCGGGSTKFELVPNKNSNISNKNSNISKDSFEKGFDKGLQTAFSTMKNINNNLLPRLEEKFGNNFNYVEYNVIYSQGNNFHYNIIVILTDNNSFAYILRYAEITVSISDEFDITNVYSEIDDLINTLLSLVLVYNQED